MSDQPVTAHVTHQFPCAPELVFDRWLDPDNARTWLFATEEGEMIRAEIDPRVGGKFNFTERRDGENVEHRGTYQEIDRPFRLAFSLRVPTSSVETDRVTIDITPVEDGCELRLTHEMPGGGEGDVEQAELGWTRAITGLAATLSGM